MTFSDSYGHRTTLPIGNYTTFIIYNELGEAVGFSIDDGTDIKAYYYLKDVTGQIDAVVDVETNTIIYSCTYDAWGSILDEYCTDALVAYGNPLRYKDYNYDIDSDLYYLQSRYYDSYMGRFLNADEPILSEIGIQQTNSNNMYLYCGNDPINDADPSGSISFNQLKTALSNAMNAVKNAVQKIVRKIGIWRSGSYLYVKTSLLAGAIDTAIIAGSAAKMVAIKSAFKVAVKFLKSNEKNFIKFLKNTLFPFISNNVTSVINFCLKAFATSFGLKFASSLVKGKVQDALFGNFILYKWYNAFSSAGNIVANIFDIVTDWSWNNQIRIKIK